MTSPSKQLKNDEISLNEVAQKLKQLWGDLLKKWIIILIAAIIGGATGFFYAYFTKPVYTAQLSFVSEDEKSGGINGALGLASQFGLDLGGASGNAFSGDNLLELFKSRSVIEKTLLTTININGRKQTLAEFYISFNELRNKWKNNSELKNIHYLPYADRTKFTLKQDSMLGVFQKSILANNLLIDKSDKKINLISLRVKSTNEIFSKNFVEVLVQVVSDFYRQTKTKKASYNVAILKHQTDSVRNALNNAIFGVASSIDATPNSNPLFQTLRVSSQRKQIDVQANTAILNELVKNLELSKMSLLQQTPLIQIIDTPILPLEKVRLSKSISLVVGGVIAAVLMIIVLLLKKIFKDMTIADK